MPFKLINKLMLILTSILLFFVIIFSICFGFIFLKHANDVENSRLETTALSFADVLSKTTADNVPITLIYNNNVLQLLNVLNQNEIWLVDKNTLQMVGSRSYPNLNYNQISPQCQNDIQTIFTGQNIRSKDFATFTNPNYITIGVPVYNKAGEVKAALLLHDELPSIQHSWYDGIAILLFCTVILFFISLFLLRYLVRKYILSLNVLNKFMQKMMNHNYDTQIKTKSTDEIALLAQNLNKLSFYLKNMENTTQFKEKSCSDIIVKTAYKLHSPIKEIKASLNELTANNKNALTKATVNKMTKEIEKMQHLTNNLLNLTQITDVDFSMRKDLLNILDVLQDSIKARQKVADDKQISFKTHFDLVNNLILFTGDANRLKQMFCETLDKAIQLYPSNSTLQSKVTEDAQHYYIFFQNSNSEVSLTQLPDVFPQFYATKPDDSLFSSIELSIAQHLAKLHNIKLTYEQQADEYTGFKFTIKK